MGYDYVDSFQIEWTKVMWEEAIVRSVEVGFLLEWMRVGESRLR